MESSHLLVDMTLSYVGFKRRVLKESLRVLSPNRRIFVTTASLNSKMLQKYYGSQKYYKSRYF